MEGIEGRKQAHEGREMTKWVRADRCPGVPDGMFLVGTEEVRREPRKQVEQDSVHPARVWAGQGTLESWPWSAPTFQGGSLTCSWIHPCFLDGVSPGHCLRGNIYPLGPSGPRLALGGQGQASLGPQLSLWEPLVPMPPAAYSGGVPSLWVDYRLEAWGPRDAGQPRGEPGEGGEMRCQGFPGSSWDGVSGAAATESGEQGQGAEGSAGSRPRADSPAGFSAGMLPSCGGPARNAREREAPPGPQWDPPLARMPLATGSRSNWAQIALAEGADWSAASRVPRALPGVGRAGGGGTGFKWTHLPQGHSEMIDSGAEPGGQPGLEARRRPGWLGLAARGAALPCFLALPGRMLTPGDTECLPPRCRPSAWPLRSCSAHHRDSGF